MVKPKNLWEGFILLDINIKMSIGMTVGLWLFYAFGALPAVKAWQLAIANVILVVGLLNTKKEKPKEKEEKVKNNDFGKLKTY